MNIVIQVGFLKINSSRILHSCRPRSLRFCVGKRFKVSKLVYILVTMIRKDPRKIWKNFCENYHLSWRPASNDSLLFEKVFEISEQLFNEVIFFNISKKN